MPGVEETESLTSRIDKLEKAEIAIIYEVSGTYRRAKVYPGRI